MSKYFPNISESFLIALLFLTLTILFSPLTFLFNDFLSKEFIFFIQYILTAGTTFSISFLVLKKKIKECFIIYKITFPKFQVLVLSTIVVLIIQICITYPLISLIPMPEIMVNFFQSLGEYEGFFAIIIFVVLAPVFEELIFRGIMLDGLLKTKSQKTAIIVSSLLFGLVHANPWQFVNAFCIGLFLGWLYCKSKNMILIILLHAFINLFAYCLKYFVESSISFSINYIDAIGGYLNLGIMILSITPIATLCLNRLNKLI